jgi:hypothetical protein
VTETDTEPTAEPAAADTVAATPAAASSQTADPHLAARIKAGADATMGVMAAVLKGMVVALSIVVVVGACVMVWRDVTNRTVVVEVGPETEKTIQAIGSDIDLAQALVDAMNERISGVREIINAQGVSDAAAEAPLEPVSLKAAGLDLSTLDLTRLIDRSLNLPPQPRVRLALQCASTPCTGHATLVAYMAGPNGPHTASFPVTLGTTGLRHSLLQPVQQIADLMLQQTDPLAASVLFLNRALSQDAFADQLRVDLVRTEGAAIAAGQGPGDHGCTVELAIGSSLALRGAAVAGQEALDRASRRSVACAVRAATTEVFGLSLFELCAPSAADRAAWHAASVRALSGSPRPGRHEGGLDDRIYFRIPAAELEIEVTQAIEAAGDGAARAYCANAWGPAAGPSGETAGRLRQILTDAQTKLPPDAPPIWRHQALQLLWRAMRAGVLRDALADRLALASDMLRVVRAEEVDDPEPRALFVLDGALSLEFGRAAFEAIDRPAAEKIALARSLVPGGPQASLSPDSVLTVAAGRAQNEMIVAYENAVVTKALAPLIEPVPDVFVYRLLGDAWYVAGQEVAARDAYRRAVDAFLEAGEPVEQFLPVAVVLGLWANLRINAGACQPGAPADRTWDDRWTQVSDPLVNVCTLTGATEGGAPPALSPGINDLVRKALMDCATPAAGVPAGVHDDRSAIKSRLALLDCHATKGANDPSLRSRLLAETVHDMIARPTGAHAVQP